MTDYPAELVERVARGICAGYDDMSWDGMIPAYRAKFKYDATAALDAVMEGVTLEWIPASFILEYVITLIGKYSVKRGGDGLWGVYFTTKDEPISKPFAWKPGPDEAKAAALAHYRAQIIKAIGGE